MNAIYKCHMAKLLYYLNWLKDTPYSSGIQNYDQWTEFPLDIIRRCNQVPVFISEQLSMSTELVIHLYWSLDQIDENHNASLKGRSGKKKKKSPSHKLDEDFRHRMGTDLIQRSNSTDLAIPTE